MGPAENKKNVPQTLVITWTLYRDLGKIFRSFINLPYIKLGQSKKRGVYFHKISGGT